MKIYVAIAFRYGDMSMPIPIASTWDRDEMPLRLHEFEERLGSSGESLDNYRVVEVAVDEPKHGQFTNWETWAFFTYFIDILDRSMMAACQKIKDREIDSIYDAVALVIQDVKHKLRQHVKGMRSDEVLWGDRFVAALVERFTRRVDWDSVEKYAKAVIMRTY